MGSLSFEEYFRSVYLDRWPALLEALQEKRTRPVSLVADETLAFSGVEYPELLRLSQLRILEGKVDNSYQLDLASVIAAAQLPLLNEASRLLDLCSAPGGKALVSILRSGRAGEYVLNDVSQPRLIRLKTVMKEFSGIYESDRLHFYKRDGSQWGLHEPEAYDSVICDVPCSSEAHGKAQKSGQVGWSLKTVKSLGARQIGILCSGFDALKPGGHVLYSTCSVNPAENDEVIRKFHKKRQGLFELAELKSYLENTEITEFGHQLFPDIAGTGPIFYCLIKKKK